MKTGLVLEGGAMRGMFTAGVLDVFLAAGVHADGVVGVSAGALFGVNYLSGQAGRAIRYNKRYNRDKNYMGLRPLLRRATCSAPATPTTWCPASWTPSTTTLFKKAACPFTRWSPTWTPACRGTSG